MPAILVEDTWCYLSLDTATCIAVCSKRASPDGSTHVVGPNQCLNQCVGCAMEASHDRQLTIRRLQLATFQPYPTLTSHALVDSFGQNFSIIWLASRALARAVDSGIVCASF